MKRSIAWATSAGCSSCGKCPTVNNQRIKTSVLVNTRIVTFEQKSVGSNKYKHMEQTENNMNFHTRKWVKPEDLNPNQSLFGGRLLQWIDEEAALYAVIQLENRKVVTKFISEINFISAPVQGDIIEIGILATHFGTTSMTMRCEVRNKLTREQILTIDKLVFVNVDDLGKPVPHGKKEITYVKDRL